MSRASGACSSARSFERIRAAAGPILTQSRSNRSALPRLPERPLPSSGTHAPLTIFALEFHQRLGGCAGRLLVATRLPDKNSTHDDARVIVFAVAADEFHVMQRLHLQTANLPLDGMRIVVAFVHAEQILRIRLRHGLGSRLGLPRLY